MTEEITNEVAQAFLRMMMGDSRAHELIDNYTNGRLIFSAIYGGLGYKYPNHEEARRELMAALGYAEQFCPRTEPVAHRQESPSGTTKEKQP